MSLRTATLASLLALALGLFAVGHATWRIQGLEAESAGLARTGRVAGDSFVETLQGEHATRQFQAFDRRRAVALARGSARRDRLLGVLLLVAGAIGLASTAAFRRMARELEEERRHLAGEPPAGPPPGRPPG